MKHIPKKEWTNSEREMVERLGYTGKTATSAVALAREEKQSLSTELADAKPLSLERAVQQVVCNNAALHWLTNGTELVCYVYGRHEEPALFLWWDKERQHYGFELNVPHARALDGYETYVRDGWTQMKL